MAQLYVLTYKKYFTTQIISTQETLVQNSTAKLLWHKIEVMKFIFTLLLIILTNTVFSQRTPIIYVADFKSSSIMVNPDWATTVADDFELVLSLCKNKYSLFKRDQLPENLQNINNFETLRKTMIEQAIVDYIFYGDILYNARTEDYEIDYYFEEINTASILIIDKLLFNNEEEINNRSHRIQKLQKGLMRNDMVCSKINMEVDPTLAFAAKSIEQEHKDSDGDGVPDIVDKEIFSEDGAIVDDRGVAITLEDVNTDKPIVRTKGISTQTLVDEMYLAFPNIHFEPNSFEIGELNYAKLHQVGLLLKQYPLIELIIEGIDNEDDNLAADRALEARNYLVEYYELPKERFILKSRVLKEAKKGLVMFTVKEEF